MALHVTTVAAKISPDDEKKNKTGLKDSMSAALGQSNVRIVSIVWEDHKNHWVVVYES